MNIPNVPYKVGMLDVDLKRSVFAASCIMVLIVGICISSTVAAWIILITFLGLAAWMAYELWIKKKEPVMPSNEALAASGDKA